MIAALCALAWVLGVLALRYALTRAAARDQVAAGRPVRRCAPITHPSMRQAREHFRRVPLPRQIRRTR